jgi:ferritin-like protein
MRRRKNHQTNHIPVKGRAMKSISVHGIDKEIEQKIGERAKSEGKSVNRIVKELIAKALGLGDKPPDNRAMFEDLSGVWTEAEEREFLDSIADLETTDEKDWT